MQMLQAVATEQSNPENNLQHILNDRLQFD